jgi:hypothetical protein
MLSVQQELVAVLWRVVSVCQGQGQGQQVVRALQHLVLELDNHQNPAPAHDVWPRLMRHQKTVHAAQESWVTPQVLRFSVGRSEHGSIHIPQSSVHLEQEMFQLALLPLDETIFQLAFVQLDKALLVLPLLHLH